MLECLSNLSSISGSRSVLKATRSKCDWARAIATILQSGKLVIARDCLLNTWLGDRASFPGRPKPKDDLAQPGQVDLGEIAQEERPQW